MSEDSKAASVEPTGWDTPKLEAALAHLERLQGELDALRPTLPNIVAPLVRPAQSKAQVFVEIRKAAVTSTNDLKAFREDWQSEQTREILARAHESASENADLAKGESVAKYGWSERE